MSTLADEKAEIQYLDEKSESVGQVKPSQIVQIGNFHVLGLQPDDAEFYTNYPPDKVKQVVHKVIHGT